MTTSANDNLAKQIQRGEIWNGSENYDPWDPLVTRVYYVDVGSKKTWFSLELDTNMYFAIAVKEGVSISSGGSASFADINMERSGSYTKEVEVYTSATASGGANLLASRFPQASNRASAFFTTQTGLILKENTGYSFSVQNIDTNAAVVQVVWFYREL